MVENVTQIRSRITKHVDVGTKIWENIMHMKKVIFGFLVHKLVKMVKLFGVAVGGLVITCYEIKDGQKLFQPKLLEQNLPKISIFCLPFY